MVLSPESTEDEAKSTVNRITEIITQQGGEITHEENWGVRRLAYPIKRFVEGNYFLARFRLESDGVLELDQTLNAAQDVLRHLVMRMDKDALAALEAKTALEARPPQPPKLLLPRPKRLLRHSSLWLKSQ